MCIADVRVMSVCVDVSIAWGIMMFMWGEPIKNVSESLITSYCYMNIPRGIMMFISVDVSIASGILMFMWGGS